MPPESPVTILLVDDRPDNLLTLEAVLKQPRYRLVTASSGAEALERLSQHEVAVMLLDVQMPEMDGFETARRVKQQPRFRDIPIIFITAINKDPVHVFRGYDAGAIDYLMKPFDDDVLRAKVGVIVELFEKTRRIQQQERALTLVNAELQEEIRERARAEAALRLAHDQLEQRVRERTAALVASNQALHEEIAARRQVQEELEASVREKEVLLREIHHRVKNNLQVISSLLSLQSTYLTDPQLLELFEDSRNRIRSMALVHETLYASANLSSIDMVSYVRDLASLLARSYAAEAVQLRLQVEPIFLGVDTAIPCGLLLNELVSNAFKHAFPDRRGGEVDISLRRLAEDRFLLTVQDTGIGVPPRVSLSNPETLGLRLVAALVSQLQGEIQLDRAEGGGASFTIRFSPVQAAVRDGDPVAA
ncbi:MAG: response regulator [Candidatus Omnitrophica bacterium]|nr:response regulator [Candidatus Omnitrophota bacterium]